MIRRFTLVFFLVTQCLAVDPPPWYVLNAPPKEQDRYLKEVGTESERLRAQVAKRRFEEKQRHQTAVAVALHNELNAQREIMASQMSAAGQLRQNVSPENADILRAAEAIGFQRTAIGAVLLIGLFLLYRYRELCFGLDPVTKAHHRARQAAEKWDS
jgi:hypothetical protein